MKKIFSIFSIALTTAACCISCTNLESEMYDVINPGIFPTTEDDANSLVTSAAYAPFRSNWYSGLYASSQGGIHVISDMTTDIGYCQWNDVVWPDMLQVNFTAKSFGVTDTYKNYIRDISKMTLTMDRIAGIQMKQETKDRLNAELRCGRGWLAYILYDMYGPIQIASLEMLKNPTSDEVAPRVSKEEMVKFIEDDLTAATALPATYKTSDTNYGRFTRGLAYTVLMKLYMHEQNWAKAVECGRELMKPEYGYELMDNYKDIFTLENEGNSEAIWSCICSRSVNQQMWLAHVLSSEYPTKNPAIQKWGGYRVMWNFYHTFDAKDKRLEVLIGDFIGEDGVHYNEQNPGSVLIEGAMPVKYGEDPDATGEESQIDWIVYRYADVLTLLSEAIVRQGNAVTQEAVDLLNKVHTRAGLTAYATADFASPAAFLDAVLMERGHELWFEGTRRTDLIRYGKYIEYARKYKNSVTAQDYMNVMPLPQAVINESKGKIAQNPGY
ncbi:RagB/SusD family nutrient uptake outer membrane protein [Bacteroides fluxus]|nr:RagB/SusD family nutrient uptake outer membrane protein [Bacteroides fluxus]MDY3789153.1 RagB/SusD family nutrient uptake outer membrane protein [Bacteroides fluxus]